MSRVSRLTPARTARSTEISALEASARVAVPGYRESAVAAAARLARSWLERARSPLRLGCAAAAAQSNHYYLERRAAWTIRQCGKTGRAPTSARAALKVPKVTFSGRGTRVGEGRSRARIALRWCALFRRSLGPRIARYLKRCPELRAAPPKAAPRCAVARDHQPQKSARACLGRCCESQRKPGKSRH